MSPLTQSIQPTLHQFDLWVSGNFSKWRQGIIPCGLGLIQIASGFILDTEVAVIARHACLVTQVLVKGEGLFVQNLGLIQTAPGLVHSAQVTVCDG